MGHVSLVETVSEAATWTYDSSASAWMATEIACLRKTLERAALKGKKMGALPLGEDRWRRLQLELGWGDGLLGMRCAYSLVGPRTRRLATGGNGAKRAGETTTAARKRLMEVAARRRRK